MDHRVLIVVGVIGIWAVLLVLTFFPVSPELAVQLSLQRAVSGSESAAAAGLTEPQYVSLTRYMLVSLAVGLLAWRFIHDLGGNR